MSIRLSAIETALTIEKISKINDRAAKRGFTGRVTISKARVEETTTDDFGFERTEVKYDVEIGGEAPSYGGWTFLARIDRLGDSFTIATAPGVDHVDRTQVHVGECDHCGQARQRNNTYLVVNDETGEVKNVGSTCIKDFLGWTGNAVFLSTDDVEQEIKGFAGTGGAGDYLLTTVLAYSYAVQKVFGWVPATDYYTTTTKQHVATLLGGFRLTEKERVLYAPISGLADEAQDKAAKVVEFLLSDEFAGTSTYVDNLKAIAQAGVVSPSTLGLAVSAPRAYSRHLETAAEREAQQAQWAAEKAARVVSGFVGALKDKVTVEGTISSIRYIEGNYGTTTLYTILGNDSNLYKWFSSAGSLGDEEGVAVKITGTVKDHDEYNGVKSTVLTRCKAV